MTTTSLSEAARTAVAQETSDLEVAFSFLNIVLPAFLNESNDRLVKLGRRIIYLVQTCYHEASEAAELEQALSWIGGGMPDSFESWGFQGP